MQEYMQAVHEWMNGQNTAIAIVIYVFSVIALWKVFNKAGEPGWTAFIPIINIYKMCKIADGNGLKCLLYLIPVVNVIYYFIMNIKMAKAFGKGTLFGLGLIFLPIIFVYILGFGAAEYQGAR